RALRPGGTVAAVDVDLPAHVCHPMCSAFARYVELYQAVMRGHGGDSSLGPRLPALLRDAGFEDLRLEVVQPTFCDGEGKFIAAVTMALLRDAVVRGGFASHAEVDAIATAREAFASDPSTVVSLPRVFQVWGRRLETVIRAQRPKRKVNGHSLREPM